MAIANLMGHSVSAGSVKQSLTWITRQLSWPDGCGRPPYVGGRGWIGVRLDRDPDWTEIAELCQDAYRAIAPPRLLAQLDSQRRDIARD
jgi:hypothetical protein